MNVIIWSVLGFWLGLVTIFTVVNWRRQMQNDEAIVRLSLALLDHKLDHEGDPL